MRTSATTRACIFATRHGESTKILMDLMEETGLISFVGKVNMDRNALDELRERNAVSAAAVRTGTNRAGGVSVCRSHVSVGKICEGRESLRENFGIVRNDGIV